MPGRMIDRLTKEQIEAIFDALPIEFIFVDDQDRLQYFNKEETRERKGPDDILGKDIRACHKPSSMARTNAMLDGFKSGEKDEDEFWIEGMGSKLLNRFLAVRDKEGKYLGCIEYILNFTAMEKLAEEKKDAYKLDAAAQGAEDLESSH